METENSPINYRDKKENNNERNKKSSNYFPPLKPRLCNESFYYVNPKIGLQRHFPKFSFSKAVKKSFYADLMKKSKESPGSPTYQMKSQKICPSMKFTKSKKICSILNEANQKKFIPSPNAYDLNKKGNVPHVKFKSFNAEFQRELVLVQIKNI